MEEVTIGWSVISPIGSNHMNPPGLMAGYQTDPADAPSLAM